MTEADSKIGIDVLNVEKADSFFVELQNSDEGTFSMVIDGATSTHGPDVVAHARRYFKGIINAAVCTHPDTDHIAGLVQLIEDCQLSHLIINDPRDVFAEANIIALAKSILAKEQVEIVKTAFERIDRLKEAANRNNVQIHSFFANANPIHTHGGWNIHVLGPSESSFKELWFQGHAVKSWFDSDSELAVLIKEASGASLLDDDSIDTTPINNTSIIIMIQGVGGKYLFTGDAGKRALREATAVRDISNLSWLDVPHHGSRRNMDTDLITLMSPRSAFISSPGTMKHPRKAVIKALQAVGALVYSTCKSKGNLYHHVGLPNRPGYSDATPWAPL